MRMRGYRIRDLSFKYQLLVMKSLNLLAFLLMVATLATSCGDDTKADVDGDGVEEVKYGEMAEEACDCYDDLKEMQEEQAELEASGETEELQEMMVKMQEESAEVMNCVQELRNKYAAAQDMETMAAIRGRCPGLAQMLTEANQMGMKEVEAAKTATEVLNAVAQ